MLTNTMFYHSAKGTTWGNHKYTAKKIVNGKVRYVYTNVSKAKNVKSGIDKLSEKIKKEKKERNAKIAVDSLKKTKDLSINTATISAMKTLKTLINRTSAKNYDYNLFIKGEVTKGNPAINDFIDYATASRWEQTFGPAYRIIDDIVKGKSYRDKK